MVWMYAYASNLLVLACISLVLGVFLVGYALFCKLFDRIDNDDMEVIISYGIKMIIFGTIVVSVPSKEYLIDIENQFYLLTKINKSINVNVSDPKTTNGEKENEEIPAMLNHECTGRVCR